MLNNIKEEKIYIYLALIFGIIFIFITPPFQSPDEDSHFLKSYNISIGKVYSGIKDNIVGNSDPTDIKKYVYDKLSYIGDRNKKYTFSELVSDQYATMNYDKKTFANYSTMNVLPIVYTAPVMGIWFSKAVAKIFGMSAVSTSYMLYFARLFSLLISVLITYFAIKITPVFRKTIFAIALMPMTLYLYSMVTYDNVLISLTLLSLAIILKLIYDSKDKVIDWKYLLIFTIIGFVLYNVKTIYALLLVLVLFIPSEKFGSKKKKIIDLLIVVFGVLVLTILFKIPYMLRNVSSDATSLIVAKQTAFVLHNPIKYLYILGSNMIGQRTFQITSMVGLFGLVDTYLPIYVIVLYLLYLLFSAICDGNLDKIKIDLNFKLTAFIISIVIICLVFTAMYILWTPQIYNKIGGKAITGVQGRYFIPLLFPLLLIFSTKKVHNNKFFDIIKSNYVLVPIICLITSVIVIILRFWA